MGKSIFGGEKKLKKASNGTGYNLKDFTKT